MYKKKVFQQKFCCKNILFALAAYLLILSVLIVSPSYSDSADQADEFFKIFAKPNYVTEGDGIVETQDGYVVAGSVFDESGPSTYGWVIKIDKAGKKQWEKELGKKARDSAFYRTAVTSDNSIVLVGSVNAVLGGAFEKSSGWIAKLKANGEVEWDKNIQFERITRSMDVQPIKRNSMIVVGRGRQGTPYSQSTKDFAFIAELDSNGNILWSKRINKGYWADIVCPLKKEGFIIGGGSWIAKIDNSGNVLWEYYFDKKGEYLLYAIKEMGNGSIIIGRKPKDMKAHYILLSKLGANGNLEWDKKIDSSGLCSIDGLWITKGNEIVAVGGTCANERERIWAAIFSISGEIKSIKKFLTAKDIEISQAIPTGEDGFIAVGSGAEQQTSGSAAWVFKTKFKTTKNK
ncbi:MAG: hypothetical protein AB1325_14245 [Nitrospirota bacterium]